jgi:methyl coenzyme M reductase gamma subunit
MQAIDAVSIRDRGAPAPKDLDTDKAKLLSACAALDRAPFEMHANILDAYKDLLLSDNFLFLMAEANVTSSDATRRVYYKNMIDRSIELTLEVGELARSEGMRHLQTIQDICEVAATYQQDDLEFLKRMDYLKPRFDTELLAYLTFAVQEESDRIRKVENANPTLQVF